MSTRILSTRISRYGIPVTTTPSNEYRYPVWFPVSNDLLFVDSAQFAGMAYREDLKANPIVSATNDYETGSDRYAVTLRVHPPKRAPNELVGIVNVERFRRSDEQWKPEKYLWSSFGIVFQSEDEAQEYAKALEETPTPDKSVIISLVNHAIGRFERATHLPRAYAPTHVQG